MKKKFEVIKSFYQKNIETPFFNHHLKNTKSATELPEAYMFDTGKKEWKQLKKTILFLWRNNLFQF